MMTFEQKKERNWIKKPRKIKVDQKEKKRKTKEKKKINKRNMENEV